LIRAICIFEGVDVLCTLIAMIVFLVTAPKFNVEVMYSQGFLSCIASFISGFFSLLFSLIDFLRIIHKNQKKNDDKILLIERGQGQNQLERSNSFIEDLNPVDIRLSRATLMTVCMLIFGAAVFGKIEGWRFDTSYFFCILSITTIGYGNIILKHTASKIFLFFYGFTGISIVGYFLLAIRDSCISRIVSGSKQILEQIKELKIIQKSNEILNIESTKELKKSNSKLHLANKVMDNELKLVMLELSKIIGFYTIYWIFGAIIFTQLEPKWSFIDSMYFCFVTITTIGYGDLYPSGPLSWEFWSFFVFISISAG
jgi:hypothetical protein